MKNHLFSLISLVCLFISSKAQIPNSGFESWTSMGVYANPDGWDQLNGMTTTSGVYTCKKGTPGNVGTSYLNLTSKSINGMGVVPGLATNGTLSAASMQVRGGTPFTTRPLGLTGSWQYMGMGDTGFVSIYLTKWNVSTMKRDTIAFRTRQLTNMVMAWAPFSIGLVYNSPAYPDTLQITLSASGKVPVDNSYLYVDDLAFSGNVPGNATGIDVLGKDLGSLSVYPNPSTDHFFVEIALPQPQTVKLQLIDGMGKVVKEITAEAVHEKYVNTMNTFDLTKGIYFLKVQTGDAFETRKISIY